MKYLLLFLIIAQSVLIARVPPGALDKKFNEVTFIMTHNAASLRTNAAPLSGLSRAVGTSAVQNLATILKKALPLFPSGSTKDILEQLLASNPVADQNVPLEQQLEDGVSAFKIPVHVYQNELYSCHTMTENDVRNLQCTVQEKLRDYMPFPDIREALTAPIANLQEHRCLLDETSRPLIDVFRVVNNWLEKNPNEVFTIYLNVMIPDRFAVQYKNKMKTLLQESGLLQKLFIYKSGAPWPTIREMISSGKRLFIYTDIIGWEDLGIYHKNNFGVGSDYDFKIFGKLEGDTKAPKIDWGHAGENQLVIVDSYVTPALAGNEAEAIKANKYAMVRDRLAAYEKTAGHQVNFFMADFYELPSKDDLIKAIADYNTAHIGNKTEVVK